MIGHSSEILDRLHHDVTLYLLPVFLAAGWLASLLAPGRFKAIEHFASRLASRKGLCLLLIAIVPVVLRVFLLAVTPVPFPKAHDEFSYLLAADTYAHGRLTNPPNPMRLYMDTFHTIQQPTYMSMYPPAQGAVLAVGEVLGSPWIGVLLSVSLMSAAILWALQGWLPPRWALLGGVLAVFHIAISTYWVNSYWGGAVAATGGALVFGALPRILRDGRTKDALWLGIGAAILANSRPLEGLIFCLPVVMVVGWWWIRGKRVARLARLRRVVLPLGVIGLLCVIFIGYDNFRLTGSAKAFPHDQNIHSHYSVPLVAWEKDLPPFHFQNPQFEAFFNQWWPTHAWPGGRPDSVMHILRAFGLRVLKFAWFYFYPELLIVFLASPWMLRDRRLRFPLAVMLWCMVGSLLVAWFMPHYAAALTAAAFLLVVQAMRHMRQWRAGKQWPGVNLSRAIVVATLLLSPIPDKNENATHSVLEYRQRFIAQLSKMPGKDLILVRYAPDHDPNTEWVFNAADINQAKIVWARVIPGLDLDPLLNYFQGRQVWVLNADGRPPTLTPFAPGK